MTWEHVERVSDFKKEDTKGELVVKIADKAMRNYFTAATATLALSGPFYEQIRNESLNAVWWGTGPIWNGVDLTDVIGAIKDYREGNADWHTWVRFGSFAQMLCLTTWSALSKGDVTSLSHPAAALSFGNAMFASALPYLVELGRRHGPQCLKFMLPSRENERSSGTACTYDKTNAELVYMALWWLSSQGGAYAGAVSLANEDERAAWVGLYGYMFASALRLGELCGVLKTDFFKAESKGEHTALLLADEAQPDHESMSDSKSKGAGDSSSGGWFSCCRPSSSGIYGQSGKKPSTNGSASSSNHVHKEGVHKDDGSYSISESFSQLSDPEGGVRLGMQKSSNQSF
jgi:hypothetical protein